MSSAWLPGRPSRLLTRSPSHNKLPCKWHNLTDFAAGTRKHLHHGRGRRILRVWKRFHTLFNAASKDACPRGRRPINLGTLRCLFLSHWGSIFPAAQGACLDAQRKEEDMKEKRVIQYTQNMEEIQRYRTIREPQAIYNITHISSVCRRERKTDGGFIWRYEDDPDPNRMEIDPDEGKNSREMRYKKNRRRYYWE